jgi:hypothetical protein
LNVRGKYFGRVFEEFIAEIDSHKQIGFDVLLRNL